MTSPSFTVGPPGPEDAAIWRELYGAYADFYQEVVTDAQLDLVWSWITSPRHDVKALLVRDVSGTAVGLAHYRPYYRPLAAVVAGHLDDLLVTPAARGTGAVDALLDALRAIACERGWSKIRWITADDNHRPGASTTRSPSAPCGSPTTCRSRRSRAERRCPTSVEAHCPDRSVLGEGQCPV